MSEKDAMIIKISIVTNVIGSVIVYIAGKEPTLNIVVLLATIAYAITRVKA